MIRKIKNFIKTTYPLNNVTILKDIYRFIIVNIASKSNDTKLGYALEGYRDTKIIRKWGTDGRSIPPPPEFKRAIIKKYAKKYSIKCFIETGTFLGHTVYGVRHTFKKIYSIELDETLYREAVLQFKRYPNITIMQGNSGKLLPVLLQDISEPCLFWLDAHFSGGITAGEGMEDPLMFELDSILTHHIRNHCILIDDARGWVNQMNGLFDYINKKRRDINFNIADDIIRLTYNPID